MYVALPHINSETKIPDIANAYILKYIHTYMFCLQEPLRPRLDTAMTKLAIHTYIHTYIFVVTTTLRAQVSADTEYLLRYFLRY